MSEENNYLTLTGVAAQPSCEIAVEAQEKKVLTLAETRAITVITDVESQNAAVAGLKKITELLKEAEDCRAKIKAPVLAIGREIETVAKSYSLELDVEKRRLALLVGAFQDAERQREEKAKREAAEKESAAIAATKAEETKRIHMEAKGRTGTLLPDLDRIRNEGIQRVSEIRQEAANATVHLPANSSAQVRKNWKFEVEDINALFNAHPELCIIEPNKAAIRAIIKVRQKIPGLRVWSESAAIIGGAVSARAVIGTGQAEPKPVTPATPKDEDADQSVPPGDY
ncbi:MAG: hypothetical protein LBK99_24175 [Opitutaceae bacterium]|jgi:hypothetical protein|nr:hypothetical protein [Opitutaceae bacterium]